MGAAFATMVAGVFSLASGLSGELDSRPGHAVLSGQTPAVSIEVHGHGVPVHGLLCAFCSKVI